MVPANALYADTVSSPSTVKTKAVSISTGFITASLIGGAPEIAALLVVRNLCLFNALCLPKCLLQAAEPCTGLRLWAAETRRVPDALRVLDAS
jgi:hypothetical protein